jgi:hypothetical protein
VEKNHGMLILENGTPILNDPNCKQNHLMDAISTHLARSKAKRWLKEWNMLGSNLQTLYNKTWS